jgi:DNA-binding transcriptional regulator GbsR (MarR family)
VSQRNLESRVKQIYREVNREHNAFQDRYDRETDHSKNFEKQAVWQVKVSKMLDETARYSHSSFTVVLR